MKKSFQELTLTDDFLFCHTFADKEIAKLFIESVIGKSISEVKYVKDQETHEDNPEKKGFALIVWLSISKITPTTSRCKM